MVCRTHCGELGASLCVQNWQDLKTHPLKRRTAQLRTSLPSVIQFLKGSICHLGALLSGRDQSRSQQTTACRTGMLPIPQRYILLEHSMSYIR
ncbi:rCG33759 [Rattus norvegicus]|uniref:RCG33759 n=1 Tax=Rattus norvegicus TaxID=10116 RepID=A6HEP8_RAT|nr:rCG33759 [Rattus norvegicus]